MDLTDAEVALAAARAGSVVVSRDYGRDHVRHMKDATDFATQTDLDAERAIVAVLAEHRPDDARTGEEFGSTEAASMGRRWLIDPLCGTLNFAAATPLAAVNVALSEGGAVRAAAVADPTGGDLFWTDGVASFRRRGDDDERLVTSSASLLVDINCDGPLDAPFLGGQLVADPRLRAAFGPRVISSTLALAWVATGQRAAYVSDGRLRDSVHFAAGLALCTAAGAIVTDLAGGPLHAGPGIVAAADRATHDALLAIVEPHLAAAE